MIGRLVGNLAERDDASALIDVDGVGYEVEAPDGTFDEVDIGEQCILYTHHVVHQEGNSLYAFPNKTMRDFFRELIKIAGIGPKSGVAILATLSVSELIRVVGERDSKSLMRVKGVGKRTAERIVIDLEDRVAKIPFQLAHATGDSSSIQSDAESALISLGYRQSEARQVIQSVWQHGMQLEELIRKALQQSR